MRSKSDGKYLVARPHDSQTSYLLLFKEQYDALSYVNTHAGEYANHLGIEMIPNNQISTILQRWGFIGVGVVSDPLIPRIEFLQRS
ncbi:MAG: hypothetical protein IGS39_26110 [Calothrix sp. C42_A2020_038]|nr:hypothetical protein [Calothrix sp. C42_A2020_038]